MLKKTASTCLPISVLTNTKGGRNDPSLGVPELSTGRMEPRVGSGHDFPGFWRVGSGQNFGLFSFSLIISWFLNQYESSNNTFGLIVFLRYLFYIIIMKL